MKILQTIIYACALLLSHVAYGSEEQYNQRREGAELTNLVLQHEAFELFDDKYFDMAINPTWETIFRHKSVKNYVRLGINPGVVQTAGFSGNVVVKVTYEKWGPNGFVVLQATRTLSVNYSLNGEDLIDDLSTFSFKDAHRIKVEIVSINNLDVDNIYLESGIDVDRVYKFNGASLNNVSHRFLDADGLPVNSPADAKDFEFSWSTAAGAEFYELEWVYINNYSLEENVMQLPSLLKYDYYLNSTRIETTKTFYSIPNIFNKGYILYRVRGIGRKGTNLDERQDGFWNVAESGTVASHSAPHVIEIEEEYDQQMNWAHQVSYTEGGKRFEAVSFSDGLGRNRQSVARNTETDQVVVSNVYYDELGRVAVSDLPTPVDGSYLHHFPDFNRSQVSGEPSYNKDYFYITNGTCPVVAQGFSLNHGAGKYYSPNNPDQDGENAHIPDAEHFPFNSVSYLGDFTGRVDKVGSAGAELTLGKGHETQYLYPSVNQNELNELFGVEVGDYSHYQKMATVDANGQIYVEITDMAGRVVASYLEGAGPANVDALTGSAAEAMDVPLLDDGNSQNVSDDGLFSELTYSQLIGATDEYTFTYSFTPQQYTSATCLASNICFDCMYELDIEIYDQCGVLVYPEEPVEPYLINGLEFDAACHDTTYADTFQVTLNKGVYTIKKRLSVSLEPLDEYWCAYIDNETCIEPLPAIFNELYLAEDFPACTDDENDYINQDPTGCELNKQIMLQDMMPHGQYGAVTQTDGVYNSLEALSVYNTTLSNALGHNWTQAGIVDENNQPITDLTYLVNNFQDEWAELLLPYHPEYCYLEFCYILDGFRDYDRAMNAEYTLTGALATGFFKPLENSDPGQDDVIFADSEEEEDPFFTSTYGSGFEDDMEDRMDNYLTIGATTFSIYEYAIIKARCPGADTEAEMNACLLGPVEITGIDDECYDDMIWANYREFYLALKEEFYWQARENYTSNCSNACIGVVCDPATPYASKISRWGNTAGLPVTDAQGIQDEYNTQVASICQQSCTQYAEDWIDQLQGCDFMGQYELTETQMAAMKLEFIALCSSGCNGGHPMAASTTPTGTTIGSLDHSINDIIKNYIPDFEESALCSELLISEPKPYRDIADVQEAVAKPLDCCACQKIGAMETEFLALQEDNELPLGVSNLEQYIAFKTGAHLTDVNLILCACDRYCPTGGIWSIEIMIPAVLGCEDISDCKTCGEVTAELDTLASRIEGYEDSPNYETILTNYLNGKFAFDLSYLDYEEFLNQCSASTENPYCTTNPLLNEWSEMMQVIALRGQLLSQTPIDLESNNIVYKFGHLKEEEGLGNLYQASVDGSELTLSFAGANSCGFALTMPENSGFEFADIVSFGSIMPVIPDEGPECGPNYNFQVEVFYYDCGQLTSAFMAGNSSCFAVSTCICTPAKLCNDPFFHLEDVCYQPRLNELIQDAMENYGLLVTEAHEEFTAAYLAKCREAFDTEDFILDGNFGRYQQTLFYYDQAGNLVRTVAPMGVNTLAQSNNAAINTNRATVSGQLSGQYTAPVVGTTIPDHNFKTEYHYNSYNQLVQTTNPDQDGETKFWYDRYGRIIASQNPIQLDDEQYSYTLYDKQGRPVEVGQIHLNNQAGSIPSLDAIDYRADDNGTIFTNWVHSGTRREVTITTYDRPLAAAIALKFANGKQENLRLRVATVTYFDVVTSATNLQTAYVSATHYSYDIHGNVIEQLQDVPQLAPVQQDVKSTQYDFELISGNVKEVHYQKDQADGITHQYEYNMMNRLTEVFTTTDRGVHQTREAHYQYYDYGPRARTEIGKYQVQGMDYAYTINGWLKGMNSSLLDEDYDIGKDGISGFLGGNTNVHGLFAGDALTYTIGYYNAFYDNAYHRDYKAISSTSGFEAQYDGDAFDLASPSLFNGNIRHLVTSITGMQAMGSVYHYDQLQRLTEMKAFYNTNTDNSWAGMAATDDYFNSYTYDQNGNIKTLKRYADNQQLMDDFSYAYPDNPITLKPWNRLNHVVDNTGLTTFTTADIESQGADNFDYDRLGQLLSDESEGISNIVWRKGDKKIKSIVRDDLNSPQVDFVYNPFGQRILKVEKPRSNGQFVSSDQWKYSYYSYDANGQVMAVYDLEKASLTSGKAILREQHLYGASRLGMKQVSKKLYDNGVVNTPSGSVIENIAGERYYEIANYQGNVNVIIKDRKIPMLGNNGALYTAVEVQTSDYYPFGMLMPGRSNSGNYRYGFQNQEVDKEIKGEGNSVNYKYRMHDPRLGRFFAVDPLSWQFPYNSPYAFSENVVINAVELEGLEKKFVTNWYETQPDGTAIVVKTKVTIDQDWNYVKDGVKHAVTYERVYLDGKYIKTHKVLDEVVKEGGMKPSAAYDYTQDVIDGKFSEDNAYIWDSDQDGTMAGRYAETIIRDLNAPDNSITTQDVEVLEATSLPIVGRAGTRRQNRLPDKGEPNSMKTNDAGTTTKKYGPDGNVQKEYNKGHQGDKTPKVEKKDHVHDYKPNPHHPDGKPNRMPGRSPKKNEFSKDQYKSDQRKNQNKKKEGG
ncbi:MAG: hypothetical protein K0R65_2743 [Crocinitomicaceae bacterium]|jgi:RHS repeat-associated protein|nr:hypothetical protein [Crocinitomicaceae bacterium]